jgi:hypothetical protein
MKEPPMIRICLLKRRKREVKVDSHLVVNGRRRRRFPRLEANGMFQAWWPMEGEGKIPFHLFPLSPQPISLKPSNFPFDLKVLLYHGSRSLFTHFLLFLDLKITIAHLNVISPLHLHCRFDFD